MVKAVPEPNFSPSGTFQLAKLIKIPYISQLKMSFALLFRSSVFEL